MKKNIFILGFLFLSTFTFAQNNIELLKDFHNGAGGYYYIYEMFSWKDRGLQLFTMSDANLGTELYVSDGTTEGTKLLKDINLGEYGSSPEYLCVLGDFVYFRAFSPSSGLELWKTDGTEEGTILVDNLNVLGDALGVFHSGAFDNKLYFSGLVDNSLGIELCVSDGTENGTHLFLDINAVPGEHSTPENFIEFDNKLYFTASDGINGRELWVTDGIVDGTQMFLDINSGSASSSPKILGVCGGFMYFKAYTDHDGEELWVTDGTVQGTVMLKDIVAGSSSSNIYVDRCACFENNMFFVCDDYVNGEELWKSDGTSDGTMLFKDFNTWGASYSSKPNNLTIANNKLYFTATTTEITFQDQLFESDGTPDGTNVYNNTPVEQLSNVQKLIACNDRLFFYGEYPQYLQLLSIGNNSTDIVEHDGADFSYINEENYGSMTYFFTVNDTICFLNEFNNGIGDAWYKLYYDYTLSTNIDINKIGFNIFPNPVFDIINVKFDDDENYSLSLFDISGKSVLKEISANDNIQLNLSGLSKGVYTLKISNNKSTNIQKIIKY